MERNSRVSAVEDDLEFTERSPEPSPNSSMMPPFRRPAPPPPTTTSASGPPRRSLGDLLPRRSLLAPEDYAKGRDSDERKSEVEPEKDKRDRRPRKKRRSRILSELRPVEGPESALPSIPPINDEDSQVSDDPLDSGERAKEAFAAQRVRMKKQWCPDLRIYMKNVHPLFGICMAHRHHPYKRGDRFLVLLVALLGALLLCGLFAIRDCCSQVTDVPVAVVSRRLGMTQDMAYIGNSDVRASYLRGNRRATATSGLIKADADEVQCLAFYADCSGVSAVCAEGSTCRSIVNDGNSSGVMQCVPDEMSMQKCVSGSCSSGWNCNQSTNLCTPASNFMCYLPTTGNTEERISVQLAAEPDDTFTAIEAIFRILQIAAHNQEENMRRDNSSSVSASTLDEDQNAQQSPSPSTTAPSTTLAPTTSSLSSDSSSNSSSSSDNSSAASSTSASHESSTSSSNSRSGSNSTSESVSGLQTSANSSVKVSITEPVNSAVYTLSSTMLIEWHVTLLSGPDLGFNHFRVDFSADNRAFDTIAPNVSTSSSSSSSDDGNSTIFQFEWDLADNSSWLCTTCVLRICALDVESASDDSFCIRTDGETGNNTRSRRLQSTTVEGSSNGNVTFQIVREAFECSCGLGHASFLLAAVIIGACIPVVVFFAEPLVTFYRDRQVFGLFARRDGPVRPVIAGYTAKSATQKGRVFLILVLLALCVACGFVAAQITTTNFLTQKGDIVVLWVVVFAIAVVLGVFVYCTLMWFVLFNLRWWRERARERREPSGLSEFRNSLLSDDVNANNMSVTNPTSPGWTMRGSGE